MHTHVSVDINPRAVESKVGAILDDSTMLKLHEALAETIDPWTPFLTGRLAGDLTIESDGVTYNVPYARKKYYGVALTKTYHPLATSHWDAVAMEQGASEILESKVKDILVARARELYG